jgi:hypothetical protein
MTSTKLNDLDSLDIAFKLPEAITDPDLRTLYEIIVVRMRREAEHLPMNTVQQLLIERIAYNYIILRDNENNNTFAHTTAQKDFNSFWLNMTKEFNLALRTTDVDFREALLAQVADVIESTLSEVDSDTAKDLREKMASAFKDIEL